MKRIDFLCNMDSLLTERILILLAMNFYIITDNTYLFAGVKHLLSDLPVSLHRVATNDIHSLAYPRDAILLLDGASHNISVREYKHINQLNTPVYFILNIRNEILSHLAGINILNAYGTAEGLRRRLINILCGDIPSHNHRVYLTRMESVILQLYVNGLSALQISQEITVKKRTVSTHLQNILHKTGIKKTYHLMLLKNILSFHLAQYG
ncbi:helix-turn-helix transcriptional regulator [Klebsiella pneumoniae]|uniref:helix-turn-helix transcriptional regulator n=1 Tax=Klebsiella pneumoniae TaxID=573 RepID=UPI001D0D2094|nr:LuxR C-terminal-related transcriptional regulator [Klebsiella pneumoniae]